MVTMLATLLLAVAPAVSSHCLPHQSCWPSNAEVSALRSLLSGKLLEPSGFHSSGYRSAVKMKDTRFPSTPAFVSMVETEQDVRASLSFALQHDLKISLKNTGHDFDGRCTAPDSFMVNVREMKSIATGPGQSIRVGAGNTWGEVHGWLKKYERGQYTIVGGAIDSVGVTGWMQGGGHGDLTRAHGLGVDNVVEVRVIVADGRALTSSATENSDLFWALRGGGGGSWGVITEITYKIHPKEPTCQLMMIFPLGPFGMEERAIKAAQTFGHLLATAPDEVGGGEIVPIADPVGGTGALTMYMRYRGSRADARVALKPLLDLKGNTLPHVLECGKDGLNPAWPWNLSGGATYIVSNFLDAESLTNKDALAEIIRWTSSPGAGFRTIPLRGCFGQVIGGAASRVSDNETAVHPGFRKGLIAMSCFAGWLGGASARHASVMDQWANSVFNNLGDGGAFVSEPQTNLPNWADRFWTMKKYEKLLAVKRKYDPANIFLVHHGVGSEPAGGHNASDDARTIV